MRTERHDWLPFCFGHLSRHQEPVKDEDRPKVGAYDERVENFTCGQGFAHGSRDSWQQKPAGPLRLPECWKKWLCCNIDDHSNILPSSRWFKDDS